MAPSYEQLYFTFQNVGVVLAFLVECFALAYHNQTTSIFQCELPVHCDELEMKDSLTVPSLETLAAHR
jgi:hypothetical protein